MDWPHILTFLVIVVAIVTFPGAECFVDRQDSFGFSAAFLLHGTLSNLGVSVLLASATGLLAIVKVLGALCLCHLGVRTLRDLRCNAAAQHPLPVNCGQHTIAAGFREGLITNVLNPKNALLYLAVFPQFVSAAADSYAKSFLLVWIHIAVNAIWYVLAIVAMERVVVASPARKYLGTFGAASGIAPIVVGVSFALTGAGAPVSWRE